MIDYQPAVSTRKVGHINSPFVQRGGCHLDIWGMGKAEANAPYNWPAIHKFHCNFDLRKKQKSSGEIRISVT
jgi:hypothetical protein